MPLPARDSELVQIMDASFADAARRAGPLLACRIGCTQCCHGAFAINALDAARLREGMRELRIVNPALAEDLERRAYAWIGQFGSAFPGNVATGILGTTPEERERFAGFANEAACPALNPATGRCNVYAWRPMTCRVFGPPIRTTGPDGSEGLGHCELCFVDATPQQIAACEMPVPLALEEELMKEVGSEEETVVAFALLPGTSTHPTR